jgi:hypothetical protein
MLHEKGTTEASGQQEEGSHSRGRKGVWPLTENLSSVERWGELKLCVSSVSFPSVGWASERPVGEGGDFLHLYTKHGFLGRPLL